MIRYVVLALSDFCFVPKIKELMKDDENVICMANGWLEDQEQQFFYNGIRTLEKRWTKCISVAGEYVEKCQYMTCLSHS